MHIEFTNLFNKQREGVPLEIEIALREALEIFIENPIHEGLRNHPLTKGYAGLRSIDVTEDWRAIYREERDKIIFIQLGTHEELYG